MAEYVWVLKQRTRSLGNRRASVRGVWNDSVSATVARRNLDPLAERADVQVRSAESQAESLETADELVEESTEFAVSAASLVEQSATIAASAHDELRSGFEFIDHAAHLSGQAHSELDRALRSLSQAGAHCGEAESLETLRSGLVSVEEKQAELAEEEVQVLGLIAGELAGGVLPTIAGVPEIGAEAVNGIAQVFFGFKTETWQVAGAQLDEGWQKASAFVVHLRKSSS